jgi:hypothetical protein
MERRREACWNGWSLAREDDMDPFPDEDELRELFGVEPALLHPNVPWRENALSFEARQGTDQLECLIEPVYGTMTLRWSRDGHELLYLDLTRVRGVEADKFRGRESLVAHFDELTGLKPLRVQVRPALHVSWGTRDDADQPAGAGQEKLPL